jgi:hypothetical protein
MLSKLEAVGLAQLTGDYTSRAALADKDVKLCQQALALSQTALAGDARQLPMQLVGRLRDAPDGSAAGALKVQLRGVAGTINAAHPSKGARCTLPRGGGLEQAGGACLATFVGSAGVAFGPGDCSLLTWGGNALRVYDRASGVMVAELTGHSGAVRGATVLGGGKTALSWSDDGSLRVWDLETGEQKQALTGHSKAVRGATVLDGGKTALSWSNDKSLRVWDLETGEQKQALTGHSHWELCATVLEGVKTELSWSGDWALRVWDRESGEL